MVSILSMLLICASPKSEKCFKGELVIDPATTSILDEEYIDCDEFYGDLNIPSGVEEIGEKAFAGCTGFNGKLILPDTVLIINQYAFSGCSGFSGELIIKSTYSLCSYCFANCTGFTSLNLPSSLKRSGEGVFYNCSGFKGELIIPASFESVPYQFFYLCTGFRGTLNVQCTIISNEAFYGCSGFDGELSITNVEYIGKRAFVGTNFKGALEFGQNIQKIGDEAFMNCTDFTSISLRGSTQLGNRTFAFCTGISSSIYLNNDPPDECFIGCTSITNVQFGQDVENIGASCFEGCISLAGTILFPKYIRNINHDAFAYCSKIEKIEFSEYYYSHIINDRAFYKCIGLTGSLNLTKNTNFIGVEAFAFCSGFNGELILPVQKFDEYIISDRAFYKCSGFIGTLDIQEYCNKIGDEAFYGCSGFNKLVLKCNNHGKAAFAYCSGFTAIYCKELKTINSYLFYGCSKISNEIEFFDLDYIFDHAFQGCSSLKGFPSYVYPKSIGAYAFEGCVALSTIKFRPDEIHEYAFANCSNITKLDFLTNCKIIKEGAFYNCYNIEQILMPYTKYIGKYAFYNCSKLEGNLTLSYFANQIDDFAFDQTHITEAIYLGVTPVNCSSNAFPSDTQFILSHLYYSRDFCGKTINADHSQIPIIDPTPTPINDIIEYIEYEPEIESSEIINNKIIDKFKDMNEKNPNSNNVVFINATTFNFTSSLNANEFIKSLDNSIINFQNGSLNVVFDEKSNYTIKLNLIESDLRLKGNGHIFIKPAESAYRLYLNKESHFNETTVLKLLKSVDMIEFESISFSNKGKLKAFGMDEHYIPISTQNISISAYAEIDLSSISIQKNMNIGQSAKLNFESTDVENAHINYVFKDYNKKDPIIIGRLSYPPKSFQLIKQGVNKKDSIGYEDFILISGLFDDGKCEEWLESIQLGDSGFTEKICQLPGNRSIKFGPKYQSIIVRKPKPDDNKNDNDNNNDNRNNGNNGKLGAGAISGIVIAIVAVIAIIVVVVIIIRNKNKNKQDISENEDIQEKNEL